MSRTRALLLGAAVLVVLVLVGARSGGAPNEGRVGYSTHLTFSGADPAPDLKRMRDAGVSWIREDFLWEKIEPERGRFDWSAPDALMAAAADAELDVLAILDYSAPWASGDPNGDVHHPPADPAAYAAYATAVVDRYGEDGTFWKGRDNPRPLRAVELWNEPWGYFFWRPDPDPAAYARLARPAAAAVREAGRDVKVLVSADLLQVRTDGTEQSWFDALLTADPELAGHVDGWSVHPYPHPRNRAADDRSGDLRYAFERVPDVRRIAKRHGADRPLWLTELGWSTAEGGEGVSEDEQARNLGYALDRALGPWREFVEVTFVYGYDRDNGEPGDLEGHYGVRRADGSLKPAWDAVAQRAGG